MLRRQACVVTLSLFATVGYAAERKKVVVYSPHGGPETLRHVEKAFEAAHPDIDMLRFDMSTAQCASRIRAERANPHADIWWGGPGSEFISAEKAGLLAPYAPSWKQHADLATRSPTDRWHANWRTPEVIMYNSKRVSAEQAPRDWDDVLDPKWKGRVSIRDPLQSGTMKTIYGAMILRAPSVEAGFEWLKRLDVQNRGRYAAKPSMMYEQLKRGAADITLWNMVDAYRLRNQKNYPFDYVLPASGTPVILEGIAILKGAPHRRQAEVFFEFVTSAEALVWQAHEFHRIPIARADVDPSRLPEWMTRQPIKAMDIDWNDFAVKSTEWMEHWKTHIRGTGAEGPAGGGGSYSLMLGAAGLLVVILVAWFIISGRAGKKA